MQQDEDYYVGYLIGQELAQREDVPASTHIGTRNGDAHPLEIFIRHGDHDQTMVCASHYHGYLGLRTAFEETGQTHRIARLAQWPGSDLGALLDEQGRLLIDQASTWLQLARLVRRSSNLNSRVEERWPVKQSTGLTKLALRQEVPEQLLMPITGLIVDRAVRAGELMLRALVGTDLHGYLRAAY